MRRIHDYTLFNLENAVFFFPIDGAEEKERHPLEFVFAFRVLRVAFGVSSIEWSVDISTAGKIAKSQELKAKNFGCKKLKAKS